MWSCYQHDLVTGVVLLLLWYCYRCDLVTGVLLFLLWSCFWCYVVTVAVLLYVGSYYRWGLNKCDRCGLLVKVLNVKNQIQKRVAVIVI